MDERAGADPRAMALKDTGLLDQLPEPAFDRVTRLAARALRAPVALMSLSDDDGGQLVFKSQFGVPDGWLEQCGAAKSHGFCRQVVRAGEPFLVSDARVRPGLADDPVVSEHGVVAYLGVPLLSLDGRALGALCVADFCPRVWNDEDLAALKDLAALVMAEVELRRECCRHARTASDLRLLSSAVEAANDSVVITESEPLDGDGPKIVFVNQAFTRVTGYAPEEAVGRSPRFLQGPLTDRATLGRIRAHLEEKTPTRAELINYHKDGSQYWVEISIRPVPDEQGRLTHFVSVQREVTERKRAEARLSESERKSRAVFDGSFQFVGMLAPDGTLLEANRRALEIVGVELDEVAGLPLPETPWFSRSPEAQAKITAAIAEARNGRFIRYEMEQVGIDGQRMTLDFSLTPIRDETGEVVMLIPEGRDITERKHAEEALQDREELLRLAAQVAGLGIWDWDASTGELAWSAEHDRLAGLPPGGFGGTFAAFEAILHPDDRAAVRLAWEKAREEGSQFISDHRYVRPDGSLCWIAARGRFLRDEATGEASRMIGVALDITKRKQLEQQTSERANRLAEADRRKDEFLALLAHELRNPLAPIAHAVKVLELRDDEAALRARMRDMIGRQVGHLSRLVNDLLDVSRMTRGKIRLRLEELDLSDAVNQAIATARPLARKRNHELTVDLPDRPVSVMADPLRLEQILVNLVSNAVKYTDPGGSIRVEAEVEADQAVIRVTDNGAGIAPELLPKVFEAFTQANHALDRSDAGLGIGLTLVRSLARMHGGAVEARSEGPGRGSTFVVRLPLVKGTKVPAHVSNPPSGTVPILPPPRQAEPLRVLVVDDNVQAAESLSMILQIWGHLPTVRHDGTSALAAAGEANPDVVLLDIGLPGIDGYAVARALRERPEHASAVIIAVSGYGRDLNRERAEGAAFDRHFLKPVDLNALERLLASLAVAAPRHAAAAATTTVFASPG